MSPSRKEKSMSRSNDKQDLRSPTPQKKLQEIVQSPSLSPLKENQKEIAN